MLRPTFFALLAGIWLCVHGSAAQAIVFWFDGRTPASRASPTEKRELLAPAGGIFCTDGTVGTGFLVDVSGYLADNERVSILVSTARVLRDPKTGYNRAICGFRPGGAPDKLITIGERLTGWNRVGFMDRNDWGFARLDDDPTLPAGLTLDFAAARELEDSESAELWAVGYSNKHEQLTVSKDCEMAQVRADPSALVEQGPLPFIIHDCDLHRQSRGGPIAIMVEGKFRIVGINVGNGQEESFDDLSYLPFDLSRRFYNFGRRLDEDLENKLVAFLSRFAELRSPSEAIQARRVLVRAVQANLRRLGYELGEADGLLGNRTRDAVRAFQTSLGINPTGEVSEELLLLLQAR